MHSIIFLHLAIFKSLKLTTSLQQSKLNIIYINEVCILCFDTLCITCILYITQIYKMHIAYICLTCTRTMENKELNLHMSENPGAIMHVYRNTF